MRLTLRSLMAYMDGNLQPDDEAEIKKKLDGSETAAKLLERMQDVSKQLREAQGEEPDANTVAEYLDNAMPDDRVPDFEKCCLETDSQLAEVTSCHQILTRVLTEPAEVKQDSRERMYGLPELHVDKPEEETKPEAEPEPAEVGAAAGAAAGATAAAGADAGEAAPAEAEEKPTIPKREVNVPDYLRDSTQNRRMIAIGLLSVALIIAVVVIFALPEKPPETAGGTPVEGTQEDPDPTEKPDGTTEGETTEGGATEGTTDGATEEPPTTPPVEPTGDPAAVVPPVTPPEGTGDPATPPAPTPGPETPAGPDAPAGPDVPAGPDSPAPVPPDPMTPPVPPAGPDTPETPPPPGPDAGTPATPPAAPPVPTAVGRFMSDEQLKRVLLQQDKGTGNWKRIKTRGSLPPNVPLIALPAYECEVTLISGITLRLLGGTRAELLPPDAQNVLGLKIDYGRVFVTPLGGTQLRLQAGTRSGMLTFADPDSEAAVEVKPLHVPGSNPEEVPPLIETNVYVKSGSVTWADSAAGAQPAAMPASSRLMLRGEMTTGPAQVAELPKWCTGDTVSFVDQRAAKVIEGPFQMDRTARTNLDEMADDRRAEVRWLARRCMAHLGHYEPIAAVLNDEAFERYWVDYRQELLDGIARGPVHAKAVHEALNRQYSPDNEQVYRLLWDYTNQQLAGGEDATLVELLNHDTLAIRVLSSLALKDITDVGLFYNPTDTETRRRQSLDRWQERLMAGAIRRSTGGGSP